MQRKFLSPVVVLSEQNQMIYCRLKLWRISHLFIGRLFESNNIFWTKHNIYQKLLPCLKRNVKIVSDSTVWKSSILFAKKNSTRSICLKIESNMKLVKMYRNKLGSRISSLELASSSYLDVKEYFSFIKSIPNLKRLKISYLTSNDSQKLTKMNSLLNLRELHFIFEESIFIKNEFITKFQKLRTFTTCSFEHIRNLFHYENLKELNLILESIKIKDFDIVLSTKTKLEKLYLYLENSKEIIKNFPKIFYKFQSLVEIKLILLDELDNPEIQSIANSIKSLRNLFKLEVKFHTKKLAINEFAHAFNQLKNLKELILKMNKLNQAWTLFDNLKTNFETLSISLNPNLQEENKINSLNFHICIVIKKFVKIHLK